MTLPNFWELKPSMKKIGPFLDGIQLNQLDAKQLSSAQFEDGAWEMSNREAVMEVESEPGGFKFPLAMRRNQVNTLVKVEEARL